MCQQLFYLIIFWKCSGSSEGRLTTNDVLSYSACALLEFHFSSEEAAAPEVTAQVRILSVVAEQNCTLLISQKFIFPFFKIDFSCKHFILE